jgi:hypothetical protein
MRIRKQIPKTLRERESNICGNVTLESKKLGTSTYYVLHKLSFVHFTKRLKNTTTYMTKFTLQHSLSPNT